MTNKNENPATQISPAHAALNAFVGAHTSATKMLLVAAQEYAAARCLLLNGLLPGLPIAAQVVEKFLKAHVLLHDPNVDVKKKYGHNLPKLLRDVSLLSPHLSLLRFEPLALKFLQHYDTRYADNQNGSTTMSTADLFEFDECVIYLNENLPCPLDVKMRTGLYALITFSLGYQSRPTPSEIWTKERNAALAPHLPHIERDYREVIERLWPRITEPGSLSSSPK